VEYCLRLRAGGWLLLAAPRAVVRHPAMPLVTRRVLGRTFAVGRIPPWREYYDTRNRWLLLRQHRGTALDYGRPLRRRAWDEARRTAAVLLADRAGPRRVAMRALGLLDGARGHLGRRPEPGKI
jgi:rhamnopyranosyl-N-acetylglucosaminyl-diphospho-decaprenol beta-1,3/1,4-galactofuranosyltransferase